MSQIPPVGPDDHAAWIVIYPDADLSGPPARLTTDLDDLTNDGGSRIYDSHTVSDWSDCIPSMAVSPGWRATIYTVTCFRGASLEPTADAIDLSSVAGPCRSTWNDCLSSIKGSRE